MLALQVHAGPPMTVRFRNIRLERVRRKAKPISDIGEKKAVSRNDTSVARLDRRQRIDRRRRRRFPGRRGEAASSRWQVRLRTCRGGRSEGVHVVELDNGAMCIDVLPTRGMGIWRVRRGEQRRLAGKRRRASRCIRRSCR